MGVPKFFAWLMRNYKKYKFVFQKEQVDIELIDWFLIDTNCLIHPICFKILAEESLKLSTKDDKNSKNKINFKSLENKMINAVIEYIEKLIKYVNPTKGIYIAIDGPVCCAKMKQQRQRRFRSVHDKHFFDKIKQKHKIDIPYYWNNSAISPGTKFMEKLHNKIINWAKDYINKNKIKIIYSSSNVPGEGEHKLLDFIKKNKKNDLSYVTYGLDADLIFLMLVTKSDKVYLLREAQQFDSKASKDQLNFVSLKIMRECIYKTFEKNILKNETIFIDKNRVINDFVFLCYFLGNDFLPHILSLDINKNGIEYILEKYSDTYLQQFDYILGEDTKTINQQFINLFLEKLAFSEESILIENFNHKKKIRLFGETKYEKELYKIDNLLFKIPDPIGVGVNSNYRNNYYKHYFNLNDNEIEEFVSRMVRHYLMGIKWVMFYYFDKIPDWTWFYPYDYPPFISDIYKYLINFDDIKFKEGKPMEPFEQLLNILPSQSAKYLLPNSLVKLVTANKSSIIHLYPLNVDIDFLYKHKYWEGIPKLPPMEIKLVKHSYLKYKDEIDKTDLNRNRIEDDIIYDTSLITI
jgi:5'-3' exonuclease